MASLQWPDIAKQTTSKQNYLKLSSLNTGHRTIRYLKVTSRSIWPGDPNDPSDLKDGTTLLFLGADVLKECSVSVKNMGRTHFAHSRGGHCLRLVTTYRLNSMASNPWMYDVKGLMYVAFNMYSYAEQVAISRCLFTLWSKVGARRLPADLTLNPNDIFVNDHSVAEFSVLVDGPRALCKMCEAERNSKEAGTQTIKTTSEHKSVSATCEVDSKEIQTTLENIRMNGAYQICEAKRNCKEVGTQTRKISIEDKSISATRQVHSKAIQTASEKVGVKRKFVGEFKNCGGSVTQTFLDVFGDVMKEFVNHSASDIYFYKVYHLFETFLFLVNDELSLIETTTTGIFPFHLMVEYACAKKSCRSRHDRANTMVQREILYQDSLLKIYSKWLGMQFRNFRYAITSQVEDFKKRLMAENRFLPEPAELLKDNSLFPTCMIDFLSQWLDSKHDDADEFQFSEILLVLELMSDNLITGVGHVVYTKLKSMNTM